MRIFLSLCVALALALTGLPGPVAANSMMMMQRQQQNMMMQQQQQRMMQQPTFTRTPCEAFSMAMFVRSTIGSNRLPMYS